jgi:hypothetical protein
MLNCHPNRFLTHVSNGAQAMAGWALPEEEGNDWLR